MKESNKQRIDIIYPTTLGDASPEILALCELFINELIKTKVKEICCKINTQINHVECNSREIKDVLTLVLKTKKIESFYKQFINLLHKSDADNLHFKCLGRLKLVKDKALLTFFVNEEEGLPNFKWKISI